MSVHPFAGARVGVLMGGLSTERAVSLKSGKAVLKALVERGWDAVAIDVDRSLPARLLEAEVDVAWLALHGRFGEDGCVQGLLEVMGIPYTGSDVLASSVAMDKIATKRAVSACTEIRLAADWVIHEGQPWPEGLPAQAVIKPAVGGSSIGVQVVHDISERDDAIVSALSLDRAVLVEECIVGEEITVAVIDGRALPVVHIRPVDGWFDLDAKYQEGKTVYTVPAPIPDRARDEAQRAAVAAYREVRCRGLARADFILPPDGSPPVFLEINTLPGMTPTSLSPMAAGEAGISFGELCERILAGAACLPSEAEG